MKSLPSPWYLTKWSARSDSRRSRNEAAAGDLGADTAIEATARRGRGFPRNGRRRRLPEEGAVEVVKLAAKDVTLAAAAAGDMATSARAGRGLEEGPCRRRCRLMTGSFLLYASGLHVTRWPTVIEARVIWVDVARSFFFLTEHDPLRIGWI